MYRNISSFWLKNFASRSPSPTEGLDGTNYLKGLGWRWDVGFTTIITRRWLRDFPPRKGYVDTIFTHMHTQMYTCVKMISRYPKGAHPMRHCTSLCRMLVCTAQPPLSRITSCDGSHHARNSQWSLIKRQHQDSPRVPPYLHTYHR